MSETGSSADDLWLIDNFADNSGRSCFGNTWQVVTDQVMGGVSSGKSAWAVIDGHPCLHLTGDVSLARHGGFLQVSLSLLRDGVAFDASPFQGLHFLHWEMMSAIKFTFALRPAGCLGNFTLRSSRQRHHGRR